MKYYNYETLFPIEAFDTHIANARLTSISYFVIISIGTSKIGETILFYGSVHQV